MLQSSGSGSDNDVHTRIRRVIPEVLRSLSTSFTSNVLNRLFISLYKIDSIAYKKLLSRIIPSTGRVQY